VAFPEGLPSIPQGSAGPGAVSPTPGPSEVRRRLSPQGDVTQVESTRVFHRLDRPAFLGARWLPAMCAGLRRSPASEPIVS
jgi:hypothetical protein